MRIEFTIELSWLIHTKVWISVLGSQGVRIFPASQSVKIEETLSVTLPCVLQTSCPDSPQITWYKGKPGIGQRVLSINTAGKVLVNSNYTGRVRLEGQAGLVIISPYLSDAGNYSCEALITVDIPPIASAYVYLNVSPKKKLTGKSNCFKKQDYIKSKFQQVEFFI